jgi:polyhydroxyalkanoate synthesis regulator phasin
MGNSPIENMTIEMTNEEKQAIIDSLMYRAQVHDKYGNRKAAEQLRSIVSKLMAQK